MSDWITTPLTDALTFREGPGVLAKDFHDQGVPLVRLSGLKYGAKLLDGCNFLDPGLVAKKWDHFRLELGDVLLSTSASLGEVAVVDKSGVGAVPYTGIIGFRPKDSRVSAKFIRFLLTAPTFKAQIEAMGVGSVMKHFGPSHLKQMNVSVPPLVDQEAIAEVLGALDDKIAANTKLAATAGELAGLVFDQAATNLDIQPMSEVLSPVLGGTPQRSRAEFWGGNQLWASAKDITGAEFGVITDTDEKITQMAVSTTKAKPLPSGSVILTARGTVGAVARLATPSSFNQSCYGFVPSQVPPGVLYFAVLRATQRAKEIAHGSVFDTITMKTFDHLPFPKFDDDALSATEGRIGPLLDAVAGSVIENAKLAATRDALLLQLMSGKLQVKDAETVLEEAKV
ncbi:type I restriction enzyme S subunit [Arthrobacter sp. UYEF6]